MQLIRKKDFSIGHAIREAWHIMWKNKGLLLLMNLLQFIILIIFEFMRRFYLNFQMGLGVGLLGQLIYYSGFAILMIGSFNIYLKLAKYQQVTSKDFFAERALALKYLVILFCTQIASYIGLICLIIPGIIIGLRFSFALFVLLEKKEGPLSAMETSWTIVKGKTGKLFLFLCTCGLINMVGALCLGIGLLFTLPTAFIALALVYRQLYEQTFPEQIQEQVIEIPVEKIEII